MCTESLTKLNTKAMELRQVVFASLSLNVHIPNLYITSAGLNNSLGRPEHY